jgi:hypothetical protein
MYQNFQNPYAMQMQNLQNQIQNMNPFQQQQGGNTQIQYVNGIESANAYQMAPNSSVLLMDSNLPRFYVKTTDAAGMAAVKVFEFHEYVEQKPEPMNPEMFVTRQEFEELKQMIEKEAAHESAKESNRESGRKSTAAERK